MITALYALAIIGALAIVGGLACLGIVIYFAIRETMDERDYWGQQ